MLGPLFLFDADSDSDCESLRSDHIIPPALVHGIQLLLEQGSLQGDLPAGVTISSSTRKNLVAEHSVEALQDMQYGTVTALVQEHELAGRNDSLSQYVGQWLHFHIRGSLAAGDSPPKSWIEHHDPVVRKSAARAAGFSCSWQMRGDEEFD